MSTDSRHILGVFEDAIRNLNDDIRQMGRLARANLDHAVRGLLERNADFCNRAIADDEQVDELEKQIDREGVEIIMKFGPVAKDLRRVISTMKAATAIERISDHAVALARRAKLISLRAPVPETNATQAIYELAAAMLKDAVSSFCEGDLQSALMIQSRDGDLDDAYRDYNRTLTSRMAADVPNIPTYVDLLFCARFIERIGDQSVNISEDAVYLLTAMDIRHGGKLPEVKESAPAGN
jgi:phosphate transport system protein